MHMSMSHAKLLKKNLYNTRNITTRTIRKVHHNITGNIKIAKFVLLLK